MQSTLELDALFQEPKIQVQVITAIQSPKAISTMKWKLFERKYALQSITKKKLNVPEKPKFKCLGFTYNGAKMKKMEDPNTFKTMTKEWIWENIPSY